MHTTYPDRLHLKLQDVVKVACTIFTETSSELMISPIGSSRLVRLNRADVVDIERYAREKHRGYNGQVVIPRHIAVNEDLDFKAYD